jgi:RNA-directed DNA polymerase
VKCFGCQAPGLLFPQPARLLCLAIGAPSSPLLSNVLPCDFDREVSQFCSKLGVAYTRYADDLSFSANSSSLLATVEDMVSTLCERTASPRLTLNRDKDGESIKEAIAKGYRPGAEQ